MYITAIFRYSVLERLPAPPHGDRSLHP
jgi:hypothetical protein